MKIVLIDTQWNVNKGNCPLGQYIYIVLIDTQWNVNFCGVLDVAKEPICFNRYIVECKSRKKHIGDICYVVLIDTQWNVNVLISERIVDMNEF